MCLCMHVRVRLRVRVGVHAGVRACAYIWMYDYYIIFLYNAAQWVRGLRVCVRVCTYASIPTYMCTCVRAHVCTRERTRVRTQLRLCEGSHVCVRTCVRACVRARACVRVCVCERPHVRALVGACVFALTGHVRAHSEAVRVSVMHVHVCAGVGAHACAFAGVGQRTYGLCVRACVRVYMHV